MEQELTLKSPIRNFAIIAHIDHGKSTLADRFLEETNTIPKSELKEQFLDQNPISRERGITIKLAPVRMKYSLEGAMYTLDLIDTPGHIDFSYEVSRTLFACEGVILLIDAVSGIQAQTVAHFNSAKQEGLTIIPAINKIDHQFARKQEVAEDLVNLFGFKKEEINFVSARTGENVKDLLSAVIKKIPPPKDSSELPLRALIFDAFFDQHRGVIAFVKIVDGVIKKGDKIRFFQSDAQTNVSEVGYFSPGLTPKDNLESGEIGYIVTGIKDIRKARVGDTITTTDLKDKISPLPGYQTPKPMVFFGVYPKSPSEFAILRDGLNKISLNDASITIGSEYSSFLGSGFRVGFLGLLHAEITKERLKQEENIDPLLTKPQVLYKKEGETILEPYMKLVIFTPKNYVGSVMTVCEKKKGNLIDLTYQKENAILKYEMPFSMFIRGLSDELKSISSGFASLDYELSDFKIADVTNLEILINGNSIDVLSELVYRNEVEFLAREKVDKLKELLPKQQFRQIIQATSGGKIVARSEISPFRKDVLSKMSGGDRTRKDKLLKKQKKGKEKLLGKAQIIIPQSALYSMIK